MQISKESIYSSTALATRQREVKNVADHQVVHITENGNGAYVFCSEEIFDRELAHARAEARYEAELEFAIRRGLQDLAEGNYTDDLEGFIEGIRKERGLNG